MRVKINIYIQSLKSDDPLPLLFFDDIASYLEKCPDIILKKFEYSKRYKFDCDLVEICMKGVDQIKLVIKSEFLDLISISSSSSIILMKTMMSNFLNHIQILILTLVLILLAA